MRLLVIFFGFSFLLFGSCVYKQSQNTKTKIKVENKKSISQTLDDPIIVSKKYNPNFILCDLDGDNLTDSVKIVLNMKNQKHGFKIIFGNKNVEYLGLGKEVLGQGFDDISWAGIFEKAPKGNIYFNNVNEEGDIIGEDQVKEKDKIKLLNDGIFIHAAESCGGGVIFLKNEKFKWIQQE